MSLYGSLYAGVSGLSAQGTAVSMISDSIANINTDGFKGTEATFATLVTGAGISRQKYSSGGVTVSPSRQIDKPGLMKTTSKTTDIAITGEGMFVVNQKQDLQGEYLFTRAGSFNKDSLGNLVNNAGYYLLAWPLDSEGRLPGEPGNINTTSNSLLDSLKLVNVGSISGNASQTTTIRFGVNLKVSQDLIKGAGDNFIFPSGTSNFGISSTQVIAPNSSTGNQLNLGDTITLNPSNPGQTYTFTYGGVARSNDITTTIMGASSPTGVFDPVSNFGMTIQTMVGGVSQTTTYKYVAASPTTSQGQFNSLQTLADAINNSPGLTARVVNNRLHIANLDGNQALTFGHLGFDMITPLGLNNVTATPNALRFSNLKDLSDKISSQTGMRSTVQNPLDKSSVTFYAEDPLGTIDINATGSTVSGVTSTATTVLSQFGINRPSYPSSYPAAYSPSDDSRNLAGQKVQSQFSTNVRIFDALGTGHDFQVSFGKIANNTWTVEIYSLNPEEITSDRDDGQVVSGTLQFNGDGTLRSVSSSLTSPVEIIWANEALPSSITINWGSAGEVAGTIGATSIGAADGLRQLDSPYSVDFINQNGISAGLLSGIQIDGDGTITAQFSNGTSRNIYQIPLASFASPNNLESRAGNVYAQTNLSGNFNLKISNSGGVGKLSPGTLEQANVELSDELTKMIIAQRGYQANSKVIKIVNEMLEELNRII